MSATSTSGTRSRPVRIAAAICCGSSPVARKSVGEKNASA
jgi:hypothetical protein